MPLLEAVDDEVLVMWILLLSLTIISIWTTWIRLMSRTERNALQGGDILERNRIPDVEHDGTNHCSICWSNMTYALETNCNHRFCGACLRTMYHHNFTFPGLNYLICPLCRSEVTLLFTLFTVDEMNQDPTSEDGITRDGIVSFARSYNGLQTWNFNSLWTRLREVPTLFRHYIADIYHGHIYMQGFGVHAARMYFMFFLCLVYLLMPYDLIPENVFGLIGWFDDIVVFVLAIIYLSFLYRRFIMAED